MLAVIRNQPAIVRALVAAGADLMMRGTGAPGFHEKTALELAEATEYEEIAASLRAGRPRPGRAN